MKFPEFPVNRTDPRMKTFPVTLYFASEDGRDGYERAVRDNEVVNVVRCKNCIRKEGCAICLQLGAHGYCSNGERKGGDK